MIFEIPLAPGAWQSEAAPAGRDPLGGLGEGKGGAVPAQPRRFCALCVAGSAAVSQPCGEQSRGVGPLQQQRHRDGAICSQCRLGELQDPLPAQTMPPQSLLTLFFVNPFTRGFGFFVFFSKAAIIFSLLLEKHF